MKSSKIIILCLTILALIFGVFRFWNILNPFFAAVIISFLLTPISKLLTDKLRFPPILSVIVTVFVIFAVIVGLLVMLGDFSVRQISSLVNELPTYTANISKIIENINGFLENLHLPEQILSVVNNLLEQGQSYIATFLTSIVSSLSSFVLSLIDVVIIIILTVYFMLDGKKILAFFSSLFPHGKEEKITIVTSEISDLTWKYIRTRVIISFGMAIVTYIGLLIMGIKYALLFALISFILDFIPYFGSLIAGIIEVFYALISGSLGLAIAVAIFVIVVQQIEGNVVAPKVQGDATGIHPIVIMFALLACNQIWGPLGMLISTPIAIIVKIILREIRKYLISE